MIKSSVAVRKFQNYSDAKVDIMMKNNHFTIDQLPSVTKMYLLFILLLSCEVTVYFLNFILLCNSECHVLAKKQKHYLCLHNDT